MDNGLIVPSVAMLLSSSVCKKSSTFQSPVNSNPSIITSPATKPGFAEAMPPVCFDEDDSEDESGNEGLGDSGELAGFDIGGGLGAGVKTALESAALEAS